MSLSKDGVSADGGERFNIECASQGMLSFDDDYYKTWPAPLTEEQVRQGRYLLSLTSAEEAAVFVESRGHCLLDNGRVKEAQMAYEQACRLDPLRPRYRCWRRAAASTDSTTLSLSAARYRNYHPTLGRWIERDPVGYVDGMSLYQYCRSNPAGGTDPKGLQTDFYTGFSMDEMPALANAIRENEFLQGMKTWYCNEVKRRLWNLTDPIGWETGGETSAFQQLQTTYSFWVGVHNRAQMNQRIEGGPVYTAYGQAVFEKAREDILPGCIPVFGTLIAKAGADYQVNDQGMGVTFTKTTDFERGYYTMQAFSEAPQWLAIFAAGLKGGGARVAVDVSAVRSSESMMLGPYPSYIRAAEATGSKYFRVPTWLPMEDVLDMNIESMNAAFRNRMDFVLSKPVGQIREQSWTLRLEMPHAIDDLGYHMVDGSTLVHPENMSVTFGSPLFPLVALAPKDYAPRIDYRDSLTLGAGGGAAGGWGTKGSDPSQSAEGTQSLFINRGAYKLADNGLDYVPAGTNSD